LPRNVASAERHEHEAIRALMTRSTERMANEGFNPIPQAASASNSAGRNHSGANKVGQPQEPRR